MYFCNRQAGVHRAHVGGDSEGASRVEHLAALEPGLVDRRNE